MSPSDEKVTITWPKAMNAGSARLDMLKHGKRTDSSARVLNDMEGPEGAPKGHGNGWDVNEFTDFPSVPEHYKQVYADLGISCKAADNHYRDAVQSLDFSNGFGKNLKPTKGSCKSMINVHSGTMVVLSSYSPRHMIDKSDPHWENKLPMVSKLSDVLWIQWADVAAKEGTPGKVRDLRYIFRHTVTTRNTKFIIEQAAAKFDKEGFGKDEFEAQRPGYNFTEKDKEFTALLGTLHGSTISYLLTTHATGLPGKSIESVTIFTTEGDRHNGELYHMLFKLTS